MTTMTILSIRPPSLPPRAGFGRIIFFIVTFFEVIVEVRRDAAAAFGMSRPLFRCRLFHFAEKIAA